MAARRTTIEFGLMNLACRREGAVEAPPELKNLCVGQGKSTHAPSPLRQDPSRCPSCGEVDRATLVRGHGSGETWTIVSGEDLAEATEKFRGSSQDKLSVVPHPAADFLGRTAPGGKVYYVWPEDGHADHYALLVQVIDKHPELAFAGLMAISKGGANYLWHLRVRDGALIAEQRTREQSMKPAPEVTGTVNEPLLGMVEATLDKFVVPYDAASYEDAYEAALREAIASGETVTGEGAATPVATDTDLMAQFAALTKKPTTTRKRSK